MGVGDGAGGQRAEPTPASVFSGGDSGLALFSAVAAAMIIIVSGGDLLMMPSTGERPSVMTEVLRAENLASVYAVGRVISMSPVRMKLQQPGLLPAGGVISRGLNSSRVEDVKLVVPLTVTI